MSTARSSLKWLFLVLLLAALASSYCCQEASEAPATTTAAAKAEEEEEEEPAKPGCSIWCWIQKIALFVITQLLSGN